MRPADTWKDYELLDATDGNRLERWGETILIRPDPQVVWKTPKQSPLWAKADAVYHRSNQGGGEWEYKRRLPEKWKISCGEGEDKLTLIVSPTGFKHTGVFPEQAVNWAWYAKKIRAAGRPVKVLNLFGYTGGATLACAAAGATVCHVDASKGIVAWGKDNAAASGLADRPIRWLVDDCAKFVAREKRRGNTYDGIIMDPPSYGRGPGGEIWKLEDCIYDLISQCEEVLSDTPLFFAVNSYTTGLSPAVMEYMLKTTLVPRFGGRDQLRRDRPAGLCHRRRGALRRNRHLGRIKEVNELASQLRVAAAAPPKGGAFGITGSFTVHAKASPFEERLPPAGGRCRVATKRGMWHRAAMTERARPLKINKQSISIEWGTAPFRGAHHQKEKHKWKRRF